MEDNPAHRSHRYHPVHPVINKDSVHDIKNAEVQAAKQSHVRPQDADKSIDSELQIGDTVYFLDHEKHPAQGIISDILPRADELFAANWNTKEGRSTHAHEILYQISSSLGTMVTKPRNELSTNNINTNASSSSSNIPPYILQNDQRPMSGKEGSLMTEHKPPHRR